MLLTPCIILFRISSSLSALLMLQTLCIIPKIILLLSLNAINNASVLDSPNSHIVSGIYTIHRMRNMRFIYRNIIQIKEIKVINYIYMNQLY